MRDVEWMRRMPANLLQHRSRPIARREPRGRGIAAALGVSALLLAVLALHLLSSCGLRRSRPNVLLVTLDTTRADHIGCYGAASSHTPNLDRLAREGIRLEQALAPVPLTLPAHTTMLTGQEPVHHGVRNNGAYTLPSSTPTLAEAFAAAGYQTGAFVSSFILHHQFGLAQGFSIYDDEMINERSGEETARRLLAWLAGREERRPFFLWLHLYDPHTPWTPPRDFRALPLPTPYDQEIAAADAALGLVVEALRQQGRLDRTIVVAVGDHGEGLGDHGEREHGVFLYEETVRVPCIFRLPHSEHAGSRCTALAGLIDLAPTLLELAGLSPLPASDGRSLASALRGGAAPERPGLLLETVYPQEGFAWAPLRGLRTPEWKWIEAPLPELYRLTDDPGERTNLVASRPEITGRLQHALEAGFQRAKSVEAAEAATELSPEVAERLASLGYVSRGPTVEDAPTTEAKDPKTMLAVLEDFEEAKRALDESRFRDAIPVYRRLLGYDATNVTSWLGLGLALNRMLAHGEAEEALRRALSLSPRNATVEGALADAVFGQRRYADALELYRAALAAASQQGRAEIRIASCLIALGHLADAERWVAERITASPKDETTLCDLQARIATYREAQTAGTDTDDRRLALARAASVLDLFDETERLLRAPCSAKELEIQRLEFLALYQSTVGRAGAALETLHRLQSLGGITPQSREFEGTLLLDLDRPDEALAAYDRLLTAPGDLSGKARRQAQIKRAGILTRLKRMDEAIAALRAACAEGDVDLEVLWTDPELSQLRSRNEFRDLVDEVTSRATTEDPPSKP
jgi:tetratricopeptide (TPR) repeat protein